MPGIRAMDRYFPQCNPSSHESWLRRKRIIHIQFTRIKQRSTIIYHKGLKYSATLIASLTGVSGITIPKWIFLIHRDPNLFNELLDIIKNVELTGKNIPERIIEIL